MKLAVLCSITMIGCSSPLHFQDPTAQAVTCATGAALLPEIESLAVVLGIPPSIAADIYQGGCASAAKKGATQKDAEAAGLAPLRHAAMARKARMQRGEPE